jgi:hypothetical protein
MTLSILESPDDLAPLVHAALKAWYVTGNDPQDLMDGLLLVQEQRRDLPGTAGTSSATARRLATNQLLLESIEELEKQDQKGAQVLRLRFADDKTLLAAAHQLNVSEFTVSRMQRSAINRLAEILYAREMAARQAHVQRIESQLPPPSYTRLFGLGTAEEELVSKLVATGGPQVVAIVGIGGIGKTSLADAIARQIAGLFHFEGIIWLRSEPQTMSGKSLSPNLTYESLTTELASRLGLETSGAPDQRLVQVRQRLKDQPYLVVIDNLESGAETAYLLNHLNDLAEPSRFLLTTRTRPAPQATVYHFPVGELSLEDAGALVRQHARDIGVDLPAATGDDDLRAIYDVVGGNPLALKLVVSQLDLLPLSQVNEGLINSRPGPIEDLYRHIYWQSWNILSPEARSLLQAMPLVGEAGGQPDYLQAISKLSDDRFWPALQELHTRSLLEVRGTIQEKRYGVHRLTETFLRTEIIHWPEEFENGQIDE